MLRKTARIIEKLAVENRAIVVVGDVGERVKERMEEDKSRKLRHRIHQWSVSTLTRLLEEKTLHVVLVPERGSSSVDPFSQVKVKGYAPW